MIVGMHRSARAALPAKELDRAVRDDLVGVHVRRRAAPGLEDIDDELVVERAVDDVLSRADDRSGDVLVEQSQLAVDQRRLLLDEADGTDEATRQAQIADGEIDVRPHRVGTVVGGRRHLELAHRVALAPRPPGGHDAMSSLCSGIVMSNSAPLPGWLRAATVPPWRSATVRTM